MRLFLVKAACFLLPLAICMGLVAMLDPFGRFGGVAADPADPRFQTASVINPVLLKVLDIRAHPAVNITLGASKMGAFTPELLREVTGKEFRDLSLGGGSANEMINLFWLAARQAPLRHVIIGINVQDFNYFNDRDRVTETEATARNPLLYLVNRDVLEASWSLARTRYFGAPPPSAAPQMSRQEFWRVQVGEGAARNFAAFRFDRKAYLRFGEIAGYCRAHGVSLVFMILPSHEDIHRRIRELGAEKAWRDLPGQVAALGEVHNYDVDGDLTGNAGNFSDPFHFTHEVARRLLEDAWGAHPRG